MHTAKTLLIYPKYLNARSDINIWCNYFPCIN